MKDPLIHKHLIEVHAADQRISVEEFLARLSPKRQQFWRAEILKEEIAELRRRKEAA